MNQWRRRNDMLPHPKGWSILKKMETKKKRKQRSKREDRLYICKKCGKIVEADTPSQKRDFCSFKCSNQWKWDNIRNKEKRDILKCYWCGKEVKHSKNKIIIEGVFCSKECFYNNRIGRKNEKTSKTLIKLYSSGRISPWNKNKKMSKEFSLKCKKRAEDQWKNKEFREKQNKRDLSYLPKLGEIALKKWRKEHPEEVIIAQQKAGKILHERYLRKLGVLIDEN